jgi:hypothetical protein
MTNTLRARAERLLASLDTPNSSDIDVDFERDITLTEAALREVAEEAASVCETDYDRYDPPGPRDSAERIRKHFCIEQPQPKKEGGE